MQLRCNLREPPCNVSRLVAEITLRADPLHDPRHRPQAVFEWLCIPVCVCALCLNGFAYVCAQEQATITTHNRKIHKKHRCREDPTKTNHIW